MRIRTFLKPLSFIPAILLMYMIFTFSSQNGEISSTVSYKASCIIVKTADKVFDMGLDDYQVSYFATKINGVTRKLAHMTEYFLLAIAVSFPLYVYGLHGILLMLLAGGFCIAFACGDEYHQSFVAGRSPSVRDVAIDSFGVFVGIIIVRIIGWTGRMTIFRPVKNAENRKLTRKEKKLMKQQMKAMQSGYGVNMYSGYPEPGMRPEGPYSNPNGPYPQQPYGNGPYQNGTFQTDPYRDGSYQNEASRSGSQQDNFYQNGPYPEGPYQGGPHQNGPYQNGPYQNGPYQNGPYPQAPYQGDPQFYNQYYPYPQYMEQEDNHSSDELSDDMPLSHLLKPKK